MRAIILAAGRGMRLQQAEGKQMPKCLLSFGGRTLLARHLDLLEQLGVDEVTLALGYEPEQVEAELARIGCTADRSAGRTALVEIVMNPRYELGSVLTVHTTADAMTRGGDVLLMDADVLYDASILEALVDGEDANRLAIDRGFEPGDEPVKVCLKDGVPVEFRKKLASDLDYDTIGESVGFFRFTENTARRFVEIVAGYIATDRAHLPHEEAVRDLLLEGGHPFEVADVTGAPWIEIDFPNDVQRATEKILPRIRQTATLLKRATV
jgi:choline kinase